MTSLTDYGTQEYVDKSRPQAPGRFSYVALGYGLAVVLFAAVFSIWQVEAVPLDVHLLVILVAATCFFPLMRWYSKSDQNVPMFEMICLSYAVQFGIPVYVQPNWVKVLNKSVLLAWGDEFQALVYVEIGILAMIIGYYIVKTGSAALGKLQMDLPLASNRRDTYVVTAIAIGLGTLLLSAQGMLPSNSGPFGAVIRVLINQAYVALVILAYQVHGTRTNKDRYTFLLYTLLFALIVLGLSSGMLEQALIPLVIFITVYWHAKRKFPWRFVAIAAVGFLILNSVKIQYRAQAWYSSSDLTAIDRVTLWLDMGKQMVENTFSENGSDTGLNISQSIKRLDLLHRFVYITNVTPARIPFYEGSTYEYLLTAWIPRILWPDKPIDETNYKIDVAYGTTFPQDYGKYTGGIGLLPEAYINFGAWGIVVIMFIQGAVFGVLDTSLNGPLSEGGRAIYLSLLVPFLNGIGSSTTIFGGLLQNVLANGFILHVFGTDRKKPTLIPLDPKEDLGADEKPADPFLDHRNI